MTRHDQIAGPKVVVWVLAALLLEIVIALGVASHV